MTPYLVIEYENQIYQQSWLKIVPNGHLVTLCSMTYIYIHSLFLTGINLELKYLSILAHGINITGISILPNVLMENYILDV